MIKNYVNINFIKQHVRMTRFGETREEEVALINAIKYNSFDIVKLLIKNKADINIKVNNSTPLLEAIEQKNIEMLRYLLDKKVDVDLSNNDGDTPLMLAIKKNDFNIVELLLKHSADITHLNNNQETILMMFEFNGFAYHRLVDEIIKLMSTFIDNGIDINACDKDGKTVLMKYVNVDYRLTEFLLENGANAKSQDSNGKSVLMCAIDNSNKALRGNSNTMLPYIEKIIDQGIDVNTQTKKGKTALMGASKNHSYKIVKFLLEKGADVYKRDVKDETALFKALSIVGIGIYKEGNYDDNMNKTLKLLLEAGSDITIVNTDGYTPFMLAEKNNLVYPMKLLIKSGVDIINEDIDLQSLFIKTLFYKNGYENEYNFELADYLLEKDSELINRQNKDGNTPLLLALYDNADLGTIQYLLKNGSTIKIQNLFGFSPLHVLMKYKNEDESIIKFMLKNDFTANIKLVDDKNITPLTMAVINKKEKSYKILKENNNVETLPTLEYLLQNDLYFEREYFENKLGDLLGREINYDTRLSLLQNWSYFDKRIDVDKIDKCIFLLNILEINILANECNGKRNKFKLPRWKKDNNIEVQNELYNNLHSRVSKTFEDVLRCFIEFPKYNPKNLVKLLSLFTKENPIKYTSHSFEWSKYGSYQNFIDEVQKEFTKIDDELKFLSPNLHTKISNFLFNESLDDDKTWGKYKIGFGWSSPQLKEWCEIKEKKNNAKKAIYFPLPKAYQYEIDGKTLTTFDDICTVFKDEIEIRDDDKLNKLFEKIEEEVLSFDFEVEYINLQNITFYTDVEYFENAVTKIFEQFKEIKERAERAECGSILVEADNQESYVDIIIEQRGSTVNKNSEEMKKEIDNGDFEDIKKYLFSLCDWSIEAEFSDGNFRIEYLSENQAVKVLELKEKPQGFRHILRFYK